MDTGSGVRFSALIAKRVCLMSAVSQYCDGFYCDELLRRNDLAEQALHLRVGRKEG